MKWPAGWKRPRSKCRHCGKECALRAPSGDWLLGLYPIRHNDPRTGNACEGIWMELNIEVDEVRK